MKLWEIFRYDVTTQLRRWSTLIYGAGLIGATILAASSFLDDARRDGIFLNAPIVTAASIMVTTMIGLLVTAALAGEAATRDAQARMEPLLYTTPLPKATYLGGRFLSAFGIFALLLALVPLTLAAGRFFPGADPAYFGPFHPGAYLHAYALVALPNAFIVTALLFSLVVLTRRPMLGYLGAAGLFLNTLLQDELVAGVFGRWDLAKLFDPFGFMIGRAQWRSWTILQRNTRWLEVEGDLLTNRLLWMGVALTVLTLMHLRFRMAHSPEWSGGPVGHRFFGGRSGRRSTTALIGTETKPWHSTLTASPVRGTFDRATRVWQTLAIALHSYREMITSRAALALPAVGLLLFKITPELMEVGLGTPALPNTGRIVLLYGKFSTIGIFVGAMIVFFAGHLVWRERDAREHDIADVTPIPDTVRVLGKFAGLALLIVTLQAVQIAAGMATQLAYGHPDLEPWLYLRVLLGMKLVDYLLFAALAMALHVLINHKYLSTAAGMLAWLFPGYAGQFGIEHNLLKYASDPGLAYSDLSGFGATLGPWLSFKLYWLGWALLFLLLARLFWVRGHERRRHPFTPWMKAAAVAALLLIAGVGGFVFYNTNVLNDYETDAEEARAAAEYERKYGRYAALAQPVVAATTLHVDLHPKDRRADIRGTYRLENRSGRTVDAIHLVTQRSLTGITFDRPARPALIDETLGYRIYQLATPLAPGQSLQLRFDVRLAPRGFTNRGAGIAVAENGTFLEHRPDGGGRTWLPAVGYRRGPELDTAYDRRKHGLPPRTSPPPHDVAGRHEETGIEHIDLETIIATDADQLAVAPGALRRSWMQAGRRWFHYATDAPIRNGFPILSARYAVHKSRWRNVDVEVVHHPKHAANAERFARAARASLETYSREFGPYPHSRLRLVEFPGTHGSRMTGHPATIVWSEVFAFVQPEQDHREIDFPYAVVAHEVAHQWWGNQVVPARVEGAALVSESLAWYSALLVVEETLGRKHLDRVMEVLRASYLTPNATPEVPLLRANDWLAVYRTGAFAMHALREAIGEESVNAALRRLVDEHRSGKPPFATSLDLYANLRAVTPAATRPLLKDLFENITFWDLRMKSARAEPAPGGAYRVTLEIDAVKLEADHAGREHRVPMDDLVDVTVFGERRETLYQQKHRIRSGVQTVTVTVPRKPTRAGVDPEHKLLDRHRDNNVKDVGAP